MKNDNTCLIVIALVAIVAIIALVLISQQGVGGALSAETTCYRNFYYCIEQTNTPEGACLDVQVRCLRYGP